MNSLNLAACSTDGNPKGAIMATSTPGGVCKSQFGCNNKQSCDTSQCTLLSQVSAATGL
jgi:hypothetical protein